MYKGLKIAALLAASTLALAACGSSSSGGTTTSAAPAESSSSAAPTSDVKVGLAYDIGGRGDQSFNDSAAAGLDKAAAEFGVEIKELDATAGETDAQKEERLTTLAEAGYNPIIAVGFAYAVAVGKVAPEFPEIQFAIVDDSSLSEANKNVTSLVFAENEGSFLVGAIAAQASKTGNIGFVGGVNVPLIVKFEKGFEAGAKAVNPSIKIQTKYLTEPPDFSGFGDPAKGKVAAEGMFDGGADVVYHAAGGSGGGVFEAAKAAGGLAIGVDSDQYLTADASVKDVILTSMLKRVDVAVYEMIKSAVGGTPLTGVQTFDLKADGVGFSESNAAVAEYVAKANELKDQIIAGTITVPSS
ncbi:BMP family lipoprotein [Longivirga aurantiaca]|uniref:BMP family protein n=1 Tax=Longivirga aurantiaca TaxID=1837743 RepID=A0ABW1SWP5_9ACTN